MSRSEHSVPACACACETNAPVSAQRRRIQLSKPRPVPSRFQIPRNKASCPHALQRRNVHPATLRILLPRGALRRGPGGGIRPFQVSARRLLPPRATPQSTHPLHASDWIDAAIRRAGVGRICRAAARVHRRVWDGRTDNEEGKKEFGGRVVALRSYCIFGSFFRNLGLRIRCRFASVLRRATLHASPQLAYVSRGNVPAGWRLSWWCVPTSARQRRPERPGRCAVRLCLPAPRLSYFVTDGDGKWLAISAAFAYPFRLATSVESNSPYLGASPQPWNVLVNFHGAGRRAFPNKTCMGAGGRSPYTRQTPRPVTPSCRAT